MIPAKMAVRVVIKYKSQFEPKTSVRSESEEIGPCEREKETVKSFCGKKRVSTVRVPVRRFRARKPPTV